MSVSRTKTFLISSKEADIYRLFAAINLSSIDYELLDPRQLGSEWQHVYFTTITPDECELELTTLQKAIVAYQAKGLINSFLDLRKEIAPDDMVEAEGSKEFILDFAEKLMRYEQLKKQEAGFVAREASFDKAYAVFSQEAESNNASLDLSDYGDQYKDLLDESAQINSFKQKQDELLSYFGVCNVNPDDLDDASYKRIITLHAYFELKKHAHTLVKKSFKLEEKSSLYFTFLAIPRESEAAFLELAQQENIVYEEVDWSQEIIVWKNKGGLNAFQNIAQSLGTIGTKEFDPTFLIGIFYMLFFAFCLADGLYGIIIALFTGYFLFFKKLKPSFKSIFNIFFYGSLATLLFGLLTNSWGGDFFNSEIIKTLLGDPHIKSTPINDFLKNFQLIDLEITGPVDIPLNEKLRTINTSPIVFMLGLTAGIGLVHILLGNFLRLVNSVRAKDGHQLHSLLHVSFLVFLVLTLTSLALAPSIVMLPLVLFIALGASLFIFNSSKGFGKIISGFGNIYELVSFGSDVISYTRLMAIGLTGAVIAIVVNLLANIMLGEHPTIISALIAVIILLVGHGFNLVLSLFSSYINPLRLHYVEFMPKFYKGSGKAFKPDTLSLTYAELSKK